MTETHVDTRTCCQPSDPEHGRRRSRLALATSSRRNKLQLLLFPPLSAVSRVRRVRGGGREAHCWQEKVRGRGHRRTCKPELSAAIDFISHSISHRDFILILIFLIIILRPRHLHRPCAASSTRFLRDGRATKEGRWGNRCHAAAAAVRRRG
jgi:hypothetical protein